MSKLNLNGHREDARDDTLTIRELAQTLARIKASATTDLTNSAGGTDQSATTGVTTAFVNVAASGSSLAGESTTRAALLTVIDGLSEVIAKANTVSTALGLPTITDSSGATAADGTVGAVTVSVTGATTGVKATETNLLRKQINQMSYVAAGLVNKILIATGVAVANGSSKIKLATALRDEIVGSTTTIDWPTTIAAIDNTATGTAASPGVTKVAMDAALVLWRDDVKSLATALNGVTGAWSPIITVVGTRASL